MMPVAFPIISALVALVVAIPLGPVNMEIIRRVLNRHPISALAFAVGAAVADGLWPVAAFLGLAPFLKIQWAAVVFWSLAALVLFFWGVNFIREAHKNGPESAIPPRHYKKRFSIITGFLLVLSNPGNLVTWMVVIGVFHREGFLPVYSVFSGLVLFFSAVAGTLAYFTVVILVIQRYHGAFIQPKRLRFIKTFFGCLILLTACYFAYHVARVL
ncbi:MAG TPA: LysE family transporter [bacterium]